MGRPGAVLPLGPPDLGMVVLGVEQISHHQPPPRCRLEPLYPTDDRTARVVTESCPQAIPGVSAETLINLWITEKLSAATSRF